MQSSNIIAPHATLIGNALTFELAVHFRPPVWILVKLGRNLDAESVSEHLCGGSEHRIDLIFDHVSIIQIEVDFGRHRQPESVDFKSAVPVVVVEIIDVPTTTSKQMGRLFMVLT